MTAGAAEGRPSAGSGDHLVVLLQTQDLGSAKDASENETQVTFYSVDDWFFCLSMQKNHNLAELFCTAIVQKEKK